MNDLSENLSPDLLTQHSWSCMTRAAARAAAVLPPLRAATLPLDTSRVVAPRASLEDAGDEPRTQMGLLGLNSAPVSVLTGRRCQKTPVWRPEKCLRREVRFEGPHQFDGANHHMGRHHECCDQGVGHSARSCHSERLPEHRRKAHEGIVERKGGNRNAKGALNPYFQKAAETEVRNPRSQD